MALEERLKIAEDLSSIISSDYTLWDELSCLYTEKGIYDKAIECSRKALEIIPDDPFLLHNLSYTIRKKWESQSHQIINSSQIEEMIFVLENLQKNYWFIV